MITYMQMLGIYPEAINGAIEECEIALKNCGIVDQTQMLHDHAEEELAWAGNFKDITNSIIGSYFLVTKDIIKTRFPDRDVDYFVNCSDSHFYVDGEEQVKEVSG